VGLSNWPAWRVARALGRCEALQLTKPATLQPRYKPDLPPAGTRPVPAGAAGRPGARCASTPLGGRPATGKHHDLALARYAEPLRLRPRVDLLSRPATGTNASSTRCRRSPTSPRRPGMRPDRLAVAWMLGATGRELRDHRRHARSATARSPGSRRDPPGSRPASALDALTREFRQGRRHHLIPAPVDADGRSAASRRGPCRHVATRPA